MPSCSVSPLTSPLFHHNRLWWFMRPVLLQRGPRPWLPIIVNPVADKCQCVPSAHRVAKNKTAASFLFAASSDTASPGLSHSLEVLSESETIFFTGLCIATLKVVFVKIIEYFCLCFWRLGSMTCVDPSFQVSRQPASTNHPPAVRPRVPAESGQVGEAARSATLDRSRGGNQDRNDYTRAKSPGRARHSDHAHPWCRITATG